MKANNINRTSVFGLIAIVFLTSCNSLKLIERGDYDGAIRASKNKLEGKKKKKEKDVQALEIAFEKATKRDMEAVRRLNTTTNPENWDKAIRIYEQIERRQARIEPLLPLVSKEGYQATFKFVKTNELIAKANTQAAEFHYARALSLMADARNGNRYAARDAYRAFEDVSDHFENYKDKQSLMAEARFLGITRVLFSMENDANVILPSRFEKEILTTGARDLNSFWKAYYTTAPTNAELHYKVVFKLTDIEMTPEVIREREYVDHREIEDGWDYVLDNNGNVLKDTLGNDIKTPHISLIKAFVLETYQHKAAQVHGRLEVRDIRNNNILDNSGITVDYIFENYASTFRGDRRALSNASRSRIGNSPRPFPRDEDMIIKAADELKPSIKSKIERCRVIS